MSNLTYRSFSASFKAEVVLSLISGQKANNTGKMRTTDSGHPFPAIRTESKVSPSSVPTRSGSATSPKSPSTADSSTSPSSWTCSRATYADGAFPARWAATCTASPCPAPWQPGHPEDNGYAERLMRTIKEEHVGLTEYNDFEDARRQIGGFLEDVYQRQRIHSALRYGTPAEFEALAKGTTK